VQDKQLASKIRVLAEEGEEEEKKEKEVAAAVDGGAHGTHSDLDAQPEEEQSEHDGTLGTLLGAEQSNTNIKEVKPGANQQQEGDDQSSNNNNNNNVGLYSAAFQPVAVNPWLVKGVDCINCSLGSPGSAPVLEPPPVGTLPAGQST